MSTPSSLRSVPKLQFMLNAKKLTDYTLTITQGKIFWLKTPSPTIEMLSKYDQENDSNKYLLLNKRHPLADRIDNIAISIYENAWHANNIRATNSAENWKERNRLQKLSISACDDLLCVIQIAKGLFHLSASRMYYWTNLIVQTEDFLKRWMAADQKRYDYLIATEKVEEKINNDSTLEALNQLSTNIQKLVALYENA